MTRFVGEAVGHRKNFGDGGAYKSRAEKMKRFLETGSHDDIERAQLLRENSRVPELPEFDPNHRSFVFLEVAIAGKSLGRIVIELFDDCIPVGASHFKSRCMPGSRSCLAGAQIQRLVPHYAAFFGKSATSSESMTLRPVNTLRAMQAGTVSLSMTGDEVVIALARALNLDTDGYQVVGRVRKGLEIVEALNDVAVGPDSIPFQKVSILKSGSTNSNGDFEEVEAAPVSRADAIARLKAQSVSARSAVLEALEVGLGTSKRKAEVLEDAATAATSCSSGNGSVQGSGPPKKVATAAQATKATAHKTKALDALLGDLSDSSDEEG